MVEQLSLNGVSAALLNFRNTIRSIADAIREARPCVGHQSTAKILDTVRTLQDDLNSVYSDMTAGPNIISDIQYNEGMRQMRQETNWAPPTLAFMTEVEKSIQATWDKFCRRTTDPIAALSRLRNLYRIDLLEPIGSTLYSIDVTIDPLRDIVDELKVRA